MIELTRQTLDYMFTTEDVHVDGLLPMHRIEELEGGLPRANVGPSDHMGIMVRALRRSYSRMLGECFGIAS